MYIKQVVVVFLLVSLCISQGKKKANSGGAQKIRATSEISISQFKANLEIEATISPCSSKNCYSGQIDSASLNGKRAPLSNGAFFRFEGASKKDYKLSVSSGLDNQTKGLIQGFVEGFIQSRNSGAKDALLPESIQGDQPGLSVKSKFVTVGPGSLSLNLQTTDSAVSGFESLTPVAKLRVPKTTKAKKVRPKKFDTNAPKTPPASTKIDEKARVAFQEQASKISSQKGLDFAGALRRVLLPSQVAFCYQTAETRNFMGLPLEIKSFFDCDLATSNFHFQCQILLDVFYNYQIAVQYVFFDSWPYIAQNNWNYNIGIINLPFANPIVVSPFITVFPEIAMKISFNADSNFNFNLNPFTIRHSFKADTAYGVSTSTSRKEIFWFWFMKIVIEYQGMLISNKVQNSFNHNLFTLSATSSTISSTTPSTLNRTYNLEFFGILIPLGTSQYIHSPSPTTTTLC